MVQPHFGIDSAHAAAAASDGARATASIAKAPSPMATSPDLDPQARALP
jgi:hypothetical protein